MDGEIQLVKRALVVDDDELSAELLRLMLTRLGLVAEVARDGASGLQAFSRDHFNLVLVDIKLPDMDGLELVRRLRAHSASIRLLVVSGFVMEVDEENQYTAGFDDFLTKPFSFEQFAEKVKPLLKNEYTRKHFISG